MQSQSPYQSGQGQQESHSIYQQPMAGAGGVPLVDYYAQKQIELTTKPDFPEVTRSSEGVLLKKTAFQRLEEEEGIYIKQKLEMLEVLTGCETQNTYFVYPLDKDSIKRERVIFKCQEKSGFWERNCCLGSARPFQMTISSYRRGAGEDQADEYEPFLFLDKPCRCTIFCHNRPEVRVTLVEGGKNEYIGKIIDPFSCCSLKADVYNKDNLLMNVVEGACCQLGVICPMPCEACQKVDFNVKTPSGEIVSTVQKQTAGCLKAAFANVDNFAVNFPSGTTVQEKALLMCAALLLDYSNFEKQPGRGGS